MPLTRVQMMRALDRGNEVRFERAAIKRALKNGEIRVDALLTDLPPVLESVPIGNLLAWCPGLRVGGLGWKSVLDGAVADDRIPAGEVEQSIRWMLGRRALRYQRGRVG